MKKYALTLLAFLMGSYLVVGRPLHNGSATNGTSSINASDTVVLDLSQAIISGNHIEFPISILTDDTIFSLDFSFRLNPAILVFDSIINLTNYLDVFSYYNPADSTVRFTSNSLQNYSTDTALVSVSLMLVAGQIAGSDLNSIHAYLNGSLCSIKLINTLLTGMPGISKAVNGINIFPNPVMNVAVVNFNLQEKSKLTISLFDILGNKIRDTYYCDAMKGESSFKLDVADLNSGVYFLTIESNKTQQNIKFAVSK